MRKRDRYEWKGQPSDSNIWMVTFSDVLGLLLTFFILLLAMSSMDAKALKAIFPVYTTGGTSRLFFSEMGSIMPYLIISIPYGKRVEPRVITKLIEAYQDKGIEMVKDVSKVMEVNEEISIEKDMDELNKKGDGFIAVQGTNRGLVMTLPDRILFDEGSAEIRGEIRYILTEIAKTIKRTDLQVRIEGHTDNIPIHNAMFNSNWQLSAYRAISVLKLLIKEGLSSSRISAVGYGEYRPIASNETPLGALKNRRVEIVLENKAAVLRTYQ